MKPLPSSLGSLTKLCLCVCIFRTTKSEVVVTKLGALDGGEGHSRDGRPYSYWTKIPYAQPPVGSLRLAPPVPIEGWDGVLDATRSSPSCPQIVMFDFYHPKYIQEDCLYLNVYKPKITGTNIPILVYLHGGGFFFGYPGEPTTADYIMDEDVILVTLSYRLGPLGFMSLNDTKFSGNFGIKDQVLAIEWVYNNIAAFGGDPEQITIFGESAGSASSHYLLLIPASGNKISKAFLISGTVNKSWSRVPTADNKRATERVVKELKCTKRSVEETLECLRKIKDPIELVNAATVLTPAIEVMTMAPTIEPPGPSAIITQDLTESKSSKPIVISFTAGEHLLMEIPYVLSCGERVRSISQDPEGYAQSLLRGHIDEKRLKLQAQKVKNHYLVHKSIPELTHDISMIFQDMNFIYPAMDLAETHLGPKWVYQLVHRGEVSLADGGNQKELLTEVAAHADELVLMFNRRSWYTHAKSTPISEDVRISKELVKYLVNFATHGDPTPEGWPITWKQYTGTEILRIKSGGSEMADEHFVDEQKKILDFWREVYL